MNEDRWATKWRWCRLVIWGNGSGPVTPDWTMRVWIPGRKITSHSGVLLFAGAIARWCPLDACYHRPLVGIWWWRFHEGVAALSHHRLRFFHPGEDRQGPFFLFEEYFIPARKPFFQRRGHARTSLKTNIWNLRWLSKQCDSWSTCRGEPGRISCRCRKSEMMVSLGKSRMIS